MSDGFQSVPMSRRTFVSRSSAAALGLTIVSPGVAFGSRANSRVEYGLVGCGGRGMWITNLFQEHGGYQITAAADYFEDRVAACGEKFDVEAARRFTGLDGYQGLIESGVDAVVIQSPPYFHPEQAAAAVAAGVHVYLAKPCAVDAPGSLQIADLGREAGQNEQVFLIDFQTRTDPYFIEAIRLVREGAIGEIVFGEATYHAGNPFLQHQAMLAEKPGDPERRLRAWGLDRTLSGDVITEQNVHTLDVMSWIMDAEPLSATGGGRQSPLRPLGDTWDHFRVLFEYPGDVGITFTSRQFEGHGTMEGIRNRMFGTKGVLETEYGGDVLIRGENAYPGGRSPGIYQEGAQRNVVDFHARITEGRYDNPTVEPSVRSNLVTILGRTAAYENRSVSWSELTTSPTRLEYDLSGLRK